MQTMIQLEKRAKSPLSNAQKTFNRLKKKIEFLEKERQSVHQELDACLLFYTDQIHPIKKAMGDILQELVKLLYKHYKNPQGFSKKERRTLKELIAAKFCQIFESVASVEIDPEVHAIFEDFEGVSYREISSNMLNILKEEMQQMCQEHGLDVDLSEIEETDNQESLMRKMLEAMEAAKAQRQEEPHIKPKTKKELERERKKQEFEDLQKRGLSKIYKQLAKNFHPDLEQDSEQKVEKEKLMKSLTAAYQNHDLHALLSLEMQWMNRSRSGHHDEEYGDDQLIVYNSILKDQIKALEESIVTVFFNPKYFSLREYLTGVMNDKKVDVLQMIHDELKMEEHYFQGLIEQLRGSNAKKVLRDIILECEDYA
jgi:hypothetical protein